MRFFFLAVIWAFVCCAVIPINGQTAGKNAKADKTKPANSQPPKIDAVNVDTVNVTKLNIPQQSEPAGKADNNSKESKAYFFRLIAPENLPNLILSIVGIAGVFVALRTLNAIQRQVDWMERQTGILVQYNKATRDSADATAKSAAAVDKQAGLMESQLTEIRESGKQVSRQIEILEKSVAAAEKNADAARENIELYISKERARLRIELKPLSLTPKFETTNFYTVDFNVAIDGPTAAYVTNTACVAFAIPSQVIDEEEIGSAIMMNMPSLPQVILPNSEPTEHFALFLSDSRGIHHLLPEIQSGNFLVGIRGSICYRDIFERTHVTAFRYAWRCDELFADGEHGRWEKCGKPEENRET
jgi:hypothetical protein